MGNAVLVLFLEGLVLRLLTLMALYVCPRGLSLEPLVVAMGSGVARLRAWVGSRRKARRRTVTGGGAVGSV